MDARNAETGGVRPEAPAVAADGSSHPTAAQRRRPKFRRSFGFRRFRHFWAQSVDWWKSAVGAIVSLFAALTAIVAVFLVIISLTQSSISIEPISTPKLLIESGYTPEVAAGHLRDAINRALATAQPRGSAIALRGDQPDIAVPTVGLSVQTAATLIRKFLPFAPRPTISGEFTITNGQLWLRLRSNGQELYSNPRGGSPEKPQQLIDAAARSILQEFWPYYIALTLYKREPARALEVANYIVASLPASDESVRQAHRLRAVIYEDRKQYGDAMAELETAIRLGKRPDEIAMDHAAQGLILQAEGKIGEADDKFRKASELAEGDKKTLAMIFALQHLPYPAEREYRAYMTVNALKRGAYTEFGAFLGALGQKEGAMSQYRKAIQLDPDDAVAHFNLAELLFERGLSDEAAVELRKAAEVDPSDSRNGMALVMLGGILRQQGRLDEAAAEFRKAAEMEVANPLTYTSPAPHDEQQIIESDSRANARTALGEVLRDQRKFDQAAIEFSKALKIQPRHARAHRGLALTYWSQARLDEAIKEFRMAAGIAPGEPTAYFILGDLLHEQGKLDDALVEFRKGIDRDPRNAQARRTIGSILRDQNKPDEAIREFKEAIKHELNEAGTHFELALLLRQRGDLDGAAAEFRETIRIEPAKAQAHRHLALTLGDQEKLDEAVAEFRLAIEREPSEAGAYLNLGVILQRQGKVNEAIIELRKGLERDPGNARAHYQLASALATETVPERPQKERTAALVEACRILVAGGRLSPSDPDFLPAIKQLQVLLRNWRIPIGSCR